jgi:hypothetical protein
MIRLVISAALDYTLASSFQPPRAGIVSVADDGGQPMGLMDSLRRAEQEGKALARRGMEKARNGAEEAERTMRRKMRVHPRAASTPVSVTRNDAPDPAAGGIISIHGRDIDSEELEKKNNAA